MEISQETPLRGPNPIYLRAPHTDQGSNGCHGNRNTRLKMVQYYLPRWHQLISMVMEVMDSKGAVHLCLMHQK